MVVYVEWVIADNMFFDCLVLFTACKTLRQKVALWRVILGGAVGTACAFASALLSGFWCVAVKLLCLPIMSLVCTRKQVLMHISLVALYTFVLGGVIVGMFFLLQKPLSLQGGNITYEMNVPFSLYGFAVVVFVWLVHLVVKYVESQRKVSKFYHNVTLHLNGDVQAVGYVDSGNTLTFCNVPVCFVSAQNTCFRRFFQQNIGNAENVELQTVNGKSVAKVLPCEITVGGVRQKVYVATSQTPFTADVLLNAFLEMNYENFETVAKTD